MINESLLIMATMFEYTSRVLDDTSAIVFLSKEDRQSSSREIKLAKYAAIACDDPRWGVFRYLRFRLSEAEKAFFEARSFSAKIDAQDHLDSVKDALMRTQRALRC